MRNASTRAGCDICVLLAPQERWLEPGAEYARPIRPVSSISGHMGTDKVKSAEVVDMAADKRTIFTSAMGNKASLRQPHQRAVSP